MFQKLAENSKLLWERELRGAGDLEKLGAYSLKEISPKLVQGYLDGLGDKLGKRAAAFTALKALDTWANFEDFLDRNITKGVKIVRSTGGHLPWTSEQVAYAEKHCRPDIARAITLGAATGQRVSDLIRMSWVDIETYKGREGINVTQKKTGRKVWIPILTKLATTMATWERHDGPFLMTHKGKVWTEVHLRQQWDYEKRNNSALREHQKLGLVMHGLRGHCCVRLSRDGLTDHQVADIVGMSIEMVGRYTRLSSQKDNAIAALFGTTGERQR